MLIFIGASAGGMVARKKIGDWSCVYPSGATCRAKCKGRGEGRWAVRKKAGEPPPGWTWAQSPHAGRLKTYRNRRDVGIAKVPMSRCGAHRSVSILRQRFYATAGATESAARAFTVRHRTDMGGCGP